MFLACVCGFYVLCYSIASGDNMIRCLCRMRVLHDMLEPNDMQQGSNVAQYERIRHRAKRTRLGLGGHKHSLMVARLNTNRVMCGSALEQKSSLVRERA